MYSYDKPIWTFALGTQTWLFLKLLGDGTQSSGLRVSVRKQSHLRLKKRERLWQYLTHFHSSGSQSFWYIMTEVFPLLPSLLVKADIAITISELEGLAGERTSYSSFSHSSARIWMLHHTLHPLELEKPLRLMGSNSLLWPFSPKIDQQTEVHRSQCLV